MKSALLPDMFGKQGRFFLCFFLFFFSCDGSESKKVNSGIDTIKAGAVIADSVSNQADLNKRVNQQIHHYLREKEIEYGDESGFILSTRGPYEIAGGKVLLFTEKEDYFGGCVNGLALMDEQGALNDFQLFSPDTFHINGICTDFLSFDGNEHGRFITYSVFYPNQEGADFFDSIENKYWIDHPELARPNEDHFSFSDIPGIYIDTLSIQRRIIALDGHLYLK